MTAIIQATPFPNKKEAKLAQETAHVLTRSVQSTQAPKLSLINKTGKKQRITLPPSVLNLLIAILNQMAKGNAVTLLPLHTELSTQEAANLLNVSRPFLIKLLDNHSIPYRMVGNRRRVRAKDILKYKTAIDNKRLKSLDALAKQAQKLNMGYE